jgi:drug/metabolite transporter (DMT)-like permease
VAALLALLSSVLWGVSDFLGGAASRRADPIRFAVLSTPLGVPLLVVFALVVPGTLSPGAIWAGVAAGVFGVFGLLLLYVVLAAGPMGVMSPVTAVISAMVPVTFGLAGGERPGAIAYLGMALAIVAIVLVSLESSPEAPMETAQSSRPPGTGHGLSVEIVTGHTATGATVTERIPVQPRVLALAVLSGALIGLFLAFIGIAPKDSGIWSVLIARLVASVIVLTIGAMVYRRTVIDKSILWLAVIVGVLEPAANVLYRLSAQSGLLAVVAVLAALYPAATVVLARFVLHERLRRVQLAGMLLALVAAIMLGVATI